MTEIYKSRSDAYDELVNHEDYMNNLGNFLNKQIDWRDKVVCEAGIGTGRVANYYIPEVKRCYGFDREDHMLEKCAKNLAEYQSKLTLANRDNLDLNEIDMKADIFVEGWSFGHTVMENSGRLEETSEALVGNAKKLVKDGGRIILIESAGTNVDEPTFKNAVLDKFLKSLELKYNFKKKILRTDYSFPDFRDAARTMGFFFGPEMGGDIKRSRKSIIHEFTGIWVLDKLY